MTLWFTSDSHFSHVNIIKYCNRPFANAGEMDQCMVDRWNECVKPSDHIYHLGDVTMMRPKYVKHILEQLNGHKRLIRGNHDIYRTKEYIEAGFEEIYGVRVIDNLLMTHIPVHPDSLGRFDANVHGHIHDRPNFAPVKRFKGVNGVLDETRPYLVPYVNICVEVTDYRPITLEEIKQRVRGEGELYD